MKESFTNVTIRILVLGSLLAVALGFWAYEQTPGDQNRQFWASVLTSLAASMVAVVVFQFIVMGANRVLKERKQAHFAELFGTAPFAPAGHIILQADRMEKVLKRALGEEIIGERIREPKNNRLYKALLWINAHDAKGAAKIRESFRLQEFAAPEIKIDGHSEDAREAHRHDSASVVICMGLGFNEHTTRTIRDACRGWMHVMDNTPVGDAFSLHENLWIERHHPADVVPVETAGSIEGYPLVVPTGWDPKVYEKVPDEIEDSVDLNAPPSRDLAMIMRHTRELDDRRKQVWFIAAGFTAHGTEAAGRYLSENWPSLWWDYRRGKKTSEAGDFCVIIAGNSGGGKWAPSRDFFPITPERLSENRIDCLWAKRGKV